jgi:hypothetical protein
MSTYEPMSFHLETERLVPQPWAESDTAKLRALHSEHGSGTPTVVSYREPHHHSNSATRWPTALYGNGVMGVANP